MTTMRVGTRVDTVVPDPQPASRALAAAMATKLLRHREGALTFNCIVFSTNFMRGQAACP